MSMTVGMKTWLRAGLLAVAAFAAPTLAGGEESYESARELFAADPQAGAAMLERLARSGEPRSQFLYGAMLIDGKKVPQDKALGFAFMKLGADKHFGKFRAGRFIEDEAGDRSRAILHQYAAVLSGRELIEADRHVAELIAELGRKQAIRLQPALVPYTSETVIRVQPDIAFAKEPVRIAVPPVVTAEQPMRLGCAAEHRGGGCRGAPKPGSPGHCTGEIVTADEPPTVTDESARAVPPRFPGDLRNFSGVRSAILIMHVDHSGFVCSAFATSSAGHPRLDAAALEAVRQWRFVPAKKAGRPVEALKELAVSFSTVP